VWANAAFHVEIIKFSAVIPIMEQGRAALEAGRILEDKQGEIMKKYKSVRTKLIAVICLSVVVTAIFCVAVNVYNFSRYYREAVDAKLNASAQSVVKAINEILRSGTLGSSGVITDWIARECERVKTSDKDIAYLAVTDNQRLIHYHTSKQLINSPFKEGNGFIDKMYPIKSDSENQGFLHIAVEKATISKKVNSFILGGALISLLILCLIIPVAYVLVSNKIVRPLKKITVMLTNIAEGEGDLTKRLERVETRDEFEVLSKKFNKFVDKIHETVVKVRENSENVSRSAGGLYAKTEEMKDVIIQQTNHAVEVATAVEEMSESTIQVAENAEHTRDEAHKSSEIAKRGEEKTAENIEIMDRLVKSVETSANAVNELGKLSDLIDQIVKVIEEIADQTNLLALNAAIEAARAGDAGRGFAVVADEVRKLAEKTATATKDIGKTVVSIKNGTVNAVSSMEMSKKEVLQSKDRIYEARTALTEIVHGADSVMEMITQIATASSQQSSVSEEISKNIEGIKDSILQTSAGTEHNVRLAGEMQQMVKDLNSVIGRFKI
jgi:methyl-accepting chemotaxis protein